VGLAYPWHYLNVRDMRTIIEAAESLVGFDKRSIPDQGTHHNALDDAKWQALAISGAWRALRLACLGDNAKAVKKPAQVAQDDEL
jgi:exodeoxyribonuclease VIII